LHYRQFFGRRGANIVEVLQQKYRVYWYWSAKVVSALDIANAVKFIS